MLVLLLVLQRFGRRQWGHISELTGESQAVLLHPTNIDGTLGKEEVGVAFYPEDKIHSSWSLLGRATTVVGASRNGNNDGGDTGAQDADNGSAGGGDGTGDADHTEYHPSGAVTKPAMVEALRVYNEARDAYREACGNVIKAHNLVLKVSWPETSRPAEWEIIGRAQVLGKNDKFIKDHISVVEYARELDRYSTRHIRKFLNLPIDKGPGTRTLRLTAMKRLRPIYDLDGKQFWDAFWQCVACIRFLTSFLVIIADAPPQVITDSGSTGFATVISVSTT